jgi:hypothetical protein
MCRRIKMVSSGASVEKELQAPQFAHPDFGDADSAAGPPWALQLACFGGLVVAVIATFLPWLSVEATATTTLFGLPAASATDSASAWNGEIGGDLRIGDWVGTSGDFPTDALVIVALAAVGTYLTAGAVIGLTVPRARYAPLGIGIALLMVGVLNYLYIEDMAARALGFVRVPQGIEVNAGASTGVYLVIVGGLITTVAGYLRGQSTRVTGH